MIKIPPYLQKGDTIGLVCPSGFMPVEKLSECIRVLNEEWGLTTKVGTTIGQQYHYSSSVTLFFPTFNLYPTPIFNA